MCEMTLVFDGDEEGQQQVQCLVQMLPAGDVRPGDYFNCPFSGYVHVHATHADGHIVYLKDCRELEHIYYVHTLLEVARPIQKGEHNG